MTSDYTYFYSFFLCKILLVSISFFISIYRVVTSIHTAGALIVLHIVCVVVFVPMKCCCSNKVISCKGLINNLIILKKTYLKYHINFLHTSVYVIIIIAVRFKCNKGNIEMCKTYFTRFC